MNKVNITAKDDFPMDSEGMDFIQKMIHQAYKLAKLGGGDYILDGCTEEAGIVSDGQVVINGELMDFRGGKKQEYIIIIEDKETIYDEDETGELKDYPEAYITRYATLADDGKLKWDNMKRVVTNRELSEKIAALRGESPGFIMMWSGRIDRMPENYMLANGDTVRTDSYPELAKAYGQEHLESFTLPNLSGRFIVGYDATDKEYKEIGIAGGANEKSIKEEQMPDHFHIYSDDTNAMGSFTLDGQSFPAKVEGINNQESSAKSGGSGTLYRTTSAGKGKPFDVRPAFYTLAYLVKVKY